MLKLLIVAVGLALVGSFGPLASAQDVYNCSDFPSQAAAQAHLRANPIDPDGLDADGDGIACADNGPPYDDSPVFASTSPVRSAPPPSASASMSPAALPPAAVQVQPPSITNRGEPIIWTNGFPYAMREGVLVALPPQDLVVSVVIQPPNTGSGGLLIPEGE